MFRVILAALCVSMLSCAAPSGATAQTQPGWLITAERMQVLLALGNRSSSLRVELLRQPWTQREASETRPQKRQAILRRVHDHYRAIDSRIDELEAATRRITERSHELTAEEATRIDRASRALEAEFQLMRDLIETIPQIREALYMADNAALDKKIERIKILTIKGARRDLRWLEFAPKKSVTFARAKQNHDIADARAQLTQTELTLGPAGPNGRISRADTVAYAALLKDMEARAAESNDALDTLQDEPILREKPGDRDALVAIAEELVSAQRKLVALLIRQQEVLYPVNGEAEDRNGAENRTLRAQIRDIDTAIRRLRTDSYDRLIQSLRGETLN